MWIVLQDISTKPTEIFNVFEQYGLDTTIAPVNKRKQRGIEEIGNYVDITMA